MGLRFIKREKIEQGDRLQFNLPQGAYSGLLVALRTKADALDAFNLADAASKEGIIIRIHRDGRQIQGEDIFTYGFLTDHFFGLPVSFPAEAEGDQEYTWTTVVVPFALPAAPNALHALTAQEVLVSMDVLDIAAVAGEIAGDPNVPETEAVVEVYGLTAPSLEETYELHVSEHDVQSSGSGRIDYTVPHSNVAALVIADPTAEDDEADSVLRTVGIIVDGDTVVDHIRDVILYSLSALNGRASLPGADQPAMGIVDLASNLIEAQNSAVRVSLGFAAGGTAQVTSLRILPGIRREASRTAVRVHLARRGQSGESIVTPREVAGPRSQPAPPPFTGSREQWQQLHQGSR